MSTAPTHALVALTMLNNFQRRRLPPTVWFAGAACAILPDIDIFGFGFGIRYGDLLGHRGLTHSVASAAVLASAVTFGFHRHFGGLSQRVVWGYLFLCTIAHGALDAATDGGLGIAFFSPFSNTRYFWPWRPLAVSPIGLRFFSTRGLRVVASELRWIWAPCIGILIAGSAMRNRTPGQNPGTY